MVDSLDLMTLLISLNYPRPVQFKRIVPVNLTMSSPCSVTYLQMNKIKLNINQWKVVKNSFKYFVEITYNMAEIDMPLSLRARSNGLCISSETMQ